MTGDLLAFQRWQHAHLAIGDSTLSGPTARFRWPYSCPGQTFADHGTHHFVILTDASREDDHVYAAHGRDHRSDLFAHGITEHLDGKTRIVVR